MKIKNLLIVGIMTILIIGTILAFKFIPQLQQIVKGTVEPTLQIAGGSGR